MYTALYTYEGIGPNKRKDDSCDRLSTRVTVTVFIYVGCSSWRVFPRDLSPGLHPPQLEGRLSYTQAHPSSELVFFDHIESLELPRNSMFVLFLAV